MSLYWNLTFATIVGGSQLSKEIIAEFARIQAVLNQWLEAIEDDDQFYPTTWALEKLWMDLEMLKATVHVALNHK